MSSAGPDSLPSHSTSSPEAAGAQWDTLSAHHPLNLEKEEQDLLRFLVQFPYILEQGASEFAPNLVCNYLFELSQKFNLFYQKHKILGSENEEFRLSLTKSVGQVLQNGLGILGIETVGKM
jgi:arginyl-tRNA synthetase